MISATATLGLLGSLYLLPAVRPRTAPGLALTGWAGTLLVLCATAVAGATILLLPHPGDVDGLLGVARQWARSLNSGERFPWTLVTRLTVGTAVLLAVARLVAVYLVEARRGSARRAERLDRLSSIGRREESVLWLEQERPLAFSLGGRTPTVVATTALNRLRPRQRSAVLAHEFAHSTGRHHVSALVVDAAARALPCVPLCRQAPAARRVLVEACAERAAAREYGAETVCAALALAGTPLAGVAGGLAATDHAVRARMLGLCHPHRGRSWPRSRWATGLATTIPGLIAATFSVVGLLLACAHFA
jgi:hypothetical protein